MAAASNPLRTEAEEFVRAEIARVGVAGLDKGAIVKRFVAAGASKSRVHEWIKAVAAEEGAAPAAPDPGEARSAATASATAAVLDTLAPPAAVAAVAVAAAEVVRTMEEAPAAAAVAIVPDNARRMLDHLDGMIEVATRVIRASHGDDGRVRNPRMALSATDQLRKVLETALKLYESVNNVRQVEAFMAEMLGAVRELSPETARAVVERMKAVQGRWAG